MNRREVNFALLGTAAAGLLPGAGVAQRRPARTRTVLYSAVGASLTQWDVDVDAATITRRESLTLPSVIQYVWPHPSKRFLYASTSDAPGGTVGQGTVHRLCALRIGATGALAMHGAPAALPQRPIHNTVDSTGSFALTAFNAPANLTIHRVNRDGTLGAAVAQDAKLDLGIFPHQVRMTPNNRSVVLVTRGNSAGRERPEDPGALKLFHFNQGQLASLASIAVGGKGGLGYGPRHLDYHPNQRWAYVLIERQNQLHMHRIDDDSFVAEPDFNVPTTEQNAPGVHQVAGAVHVHPRGHVLYASNRASGTVDYNGKPVFVGKGDNSIAVFAINPATGEPKRIQKVDPQGFHVRSFTIDPSGRLLIAATMLAMDVREGTGVHRVPAGLSLFRIEPDGQLSFVRKVDVDVGDKQQVWVEMLALPA